MKLNPDVGDSIPETTRCTFCSETVLVGMKECKYCCAPLPVLKESTELENKKSNFGIELGPQTQSDRLVDIAKMLADAYVRLGIWTLAFFRSRILPLLRAVFSSDGVASFDKRRRIIAWVAAWGLCITIGGLLFLLFGFSEPQITTSQTELPTTVQSSPNLSVGPVESVAKPRESSASQSSFLSYLDDPKFISPEEAVLAIGMKAQETSKEQGQAISALVELLDDDRSRVRSAALRSLELSGASSEDISKSLLTLIRNDSANRKMAFRLIKKNDPANSNLIKALKEGLFDELNRMKLTAFHLDALRHIKTTKSPVSGSVLRAYKNKAVPKLRKLLSQPRLSRSETAFPMQRSVGNSTKYAVLSIGELGDAAIPAVPELIKILRFDPTLSRFAHDSLKKIQTPTAKRAVHVHKPL